MCLGSVCSLEGCARVYVPVWECFPGHFEMRQSIRMFQAWAVICVIFYMAKPGALKHMTATAAEELFNCFHPKRNIIQRS